MSEDTVAAFFGWLLVSVLTIGLPAYFIGHHFGYRECANGAIDSGWASWMITDRTNGAVELIWHRAPPEKPTGVR